jgi:hypothetical protein
MGQSTVSASDGLPSRRCSCRGSPAFVLTHAAWKLGHGDIAGILRQQPAISCCTMSVEIKLQRPESPPKAQAGGFVASG